MQTRDNLRNKIKSLGVTVCRHLGPYLVFGAVATNLYILLAPKEMQDEQTCENGRSKFGNDPSTLDILNSVLIADAGIYIFNVTGVIRAVVIPTTHWAHKKVAECLNSAPLIQDHHLEAIRTYENELVSTLSTGIFIKSLPINSAASYAMLPMAGLPLVRLLLKHKLPNYPGSASLPRYREIYPNQPRVANSLAALESVWSGINLGVSFNAMTDFLMNTFYNSTRKDDWKYQAQLMYGMTALGFIAGTLSIFNERLHQYSNHASSTMQIFYLICMPLISMTMCFAPSLENTDTFMQKSIYVVLAIAAFSLIMAEVNTRLTSEHEQEQENNNPTASVSDYGIFSVNQNEEVKVDLEASSENIVVSNEGDKTDNEKSSDEEVVIEHQDAESDQDDIDTSYGSPKRGGM